MMLSGGRRLLVRRAGVRRLDGAVACLTLIAVFFSSGCRTMTHEVRIRGTPEDVWAVLVDLDDYPQWNPFFVEVMGELKVGERLHIVMVPVGKRPQSFSPKVLVVKRGQEFVWRGRLGLPGVFDGRHTFVMERIDEHTVLFRQQERFSGLLAPFVGLEPYRKGWERMDRALVERVEAESGPPAATSAD